jgi:Methylamine utilisation protein MauE
MPSFNRTAQPPRCAFRCRSSRFRLKSVCELAGALSVARSSRFRLKSVCELAGALSVAGPVVYGRCMQRILVTVSALVVAVAFAWAAIEKLRDGAQTKIAAADLGVPSSLVGPVAGALPVAELGIATLLVAGVLGQLETVRVVGALGALALLSAFSVAIARTLNAGRTPLCFCFGARSAKPLSTDNLIRNGALAVFAVITLVGS